MKITIKNLPGKSSTEISTDVGSKVVELEDVYNGVGIKTDQGHFSIAQRDSGIEVMLDRKLVWSSSELEE